MKRGVSEASGGVVGVYVFRASIYYKQCVQRPGYCIGLVGLIHVHDITIWSSGSRGCFLYFGMGHLDTGWGVKGKNKMHANVSLFLASCDQHTCIASPHSLLVAF